MFPNGIHSDKVRFVESRGLLLEEENDVVKKHFCIFGWTVKIISPNFKLPGFLLKIKDTEKSSVSFLKQIFFTDPLKSSKQP